MKVVIDTNVLVSAVLKGRVPRAAIQFIFDNPDWQWIVSFEIVAEYKEVLSRPKFKLTDEVRASWFEIFVGFHFVQPNLRICFIFFWNWYNTERIGILCKIIEMVQLACLNFHAV